MTKVVISGYYGFGNKGDDAILYAIVKHLNEEFEDLHVTVLVNKDPTILFAKEFKNVKFVKRFMPTAFIPAIWDCDLFISGGGGLFQNKTSNWSLVYYSSMVLLAKALGKKVMIYAQGLGPLNDSNVDFTIFHFAINSADLITVRDKESVELLRKIINKKNAIIEQTADPALALEPSALGSFKFKNEKRIAIIPRPWKTSNEYLKMLSEVADRFVSIGYDVYLIPFQSSVDKPVCYEIEHLMKNKPIVIDDNYHPLHVMWLVSQMELVVSMRLHGLIFAAASGTKAIGLSYDPKVTAFCLQMGIKFFDIDKVKTQDIVVASTNVEKAKDETVLTYKAIARGTAKIAKQFMLKSNAAKSGPKMLGPAQK